MVDLGISKVPFPNRQKVAKYVGYFCEKIQSQNISKVAQSGHTAVPSTAAAWVILHLLSHEGDKGAKIQLKFERTDLFLLWPLSNKPSQAAEAVVVVVVLPILLENRNSLQQTANIGLSFYSDVQTTLQWKQNYINQFCT